MALSRRVFVRSREVDALRKEQRHKQEHNHDRGLCGEHRAGANSALTAIARAIFENSVCERPGVREKLRVVKDAYARCGFAPL